MKGGPCSDEYRYDIGWIKRAPGRYSFKTFYSEPSKKYLVNLITQEGFSYDGQWRQSTAKVLRFRRIANLPQE